MLIAATSSGSDDWKLIVALAAAVLGFVGVLTKLSVDGRRAERERLRELYAGGWAAVQAYKEFAFAVRRRNIDDPAAERVRVSEGLRDVQKDLAYYEALIGRERSGRIATEFRNLVAKTREIAGAIIRRCWNEPPITSDHEMHSPEIATELTALNPFEDGYLNAVADELAGWRDRRYAAEAASAKPTS